MLGSLGALEALPALLPLPTAGVTPFCLLYQASISEEKSSPRSALAGGCPGAAGLPLLLLLLLARAGISGGPGCPDALWCPLLPPLAVELLFESLEADSCPLPSTPSLRLLALAFLYLVLYL